MGLGLEKFAFVGADDFVRTIGEEKATVIRGYFDFFFGDELAVEVDDHIVRFLRPNSLMRITI
jgi:hypothetical protein